MSWTERAADRSPLVQRWRARNMQQTRIMVDAARRLILRKGGGFTTQELVHEAGVAIQTFYRHFGGKDQLLLAALEDMIADEARSLERAARDVPDPVDRLRSYVASVLVRLDRGGPEAAGARFVTGEHWRLHALFPDEIGQAMQPMVDLVAHDLKAARRAGLLAPRTIGPGGDADPDREAQAEAEAEAEADREADRDAELVTKLITTVYHNYAFATREEPIETLIERVWQFCLSGVGGGPERRPNDRTGRIHPERA
jgi:AcrR family transcriptional regulator